MNQIEIRNAKFEDAIAGQGAAMACIGGSYVTYVYNVTFYRSLSSIAYNTEHIDVYSDGSCSPSFWYSESPCSQDCDSCDVCE